MTSTNDLCCVCSLRPVAAATLFTKIGMPIRVDGVICTVCEARGDDPQLAYPSPCSTTLATCLEDSAGSVRMCVRRRFLSFGATTLLNTRLGKYLFGLRRGCISCLSCLIVLSFLLCLTATLYVSVIKIDVDRRGDCPAEELWVASTWLLYLSCVCAALAWWIFLHGIVLEMLRYTIGFDTFIIILCSWRAGVSKIYVYVVCSGVSFGSNIFPLVLLHLMFGCAICAIDLGALPRRTKVLLLSCAALWCAYIVMHNFTSKADSAFPNVADFWFLAERLSPREHNTAAWSTLLAFYCKPYGPLQQRSNTLLFYVLIICWPRVLPGR